MFERIQKKFKLKNRQTSIERKKEYGKCPTCNRFNTWYSWCQSCDPQLLTEGWTSSNETIDELIKSTQFKATRYNNNHHLQWIPYEDFKDIEKISKGEFATMYRAIWLNGDKYINYMNNKRSNGDRIVVLKKLHKPQSTSDEFLNEVNILDFFRHLIYCLKIEFIIVIIS